MNLGWLDVCLRIENVARSRQFYEGMGFTRVEGDDAEGWAVVVQGESRIGLFEPQFMGDQQFSLNFRGGDVLANSAELEAKGYSFLEPAQAGKKRRLRKTPRSGRESNLPRFCSRRDQADAELARLPTGDAPAVDSYCGEDDDSREDLLFPVGNAHLCSAHADGRHDQSSNGGSDHTTLSA